MKDFIDDLKYMCSADNTRSRGLYIFITIALIAMLIGIVGGVIGIVYTAVKGGAILMPVVLTVVILVIFIGVVVWLKKS